MGGIIQFLIAYAAGYSLDRVLSAVRRRKAAVGAETPPTN
jgi:hypothetical protein